MTSKSREYWKLFCFEYICFSEGEQICQSKTLDLPLGYQCQEVVGTILNTTNETTVTIEIKTLLREPVTVFFTQSTQSTPADGEESFSLETEKVSGPAEIELNITAENIAGNSGQVFIRIHMRLVENRDEESVAT